MRYAISTSLGTGLGNAVRALAEGNAREEAAKEARMSALLRQDLAQADLGLKAAQTDYQSALAQKVRDSLALNHDQGLRHSLVADQTGATVPQVQQYADYRDTGEWGDAGPLESALAQAIQQSLAGTRLAGLNAQPIKAAEITADVAKTGALQQALRDEISRSHLLGVKGPDRRLSLNPVYVTDESGDTQALQLGSDGAYSQVQLPEGYDYAVAPNRQLDYLEDAAAASASGTEFGKRAAVDQMDFPAYEASVHEQIGLIDKALNHPGLEDAVGLGSGIPAIPGSEKANFNVLLDQIEGKNFLAAFESLKGGGHITEIEGQKAQNAFARLSTAQSETEFKVSLQELRDILATGLERKRGTLGVDGLRNPNEMLPPMNGGDNFNQAPLVGSEEDGYLFIGGDPSSPDSWVLRRQ
ncbi:hypothetical protein [Microbulbifer discodermiae]|uniref:hypothetical protein n=1 Tax=Microbulbifer sp. 2201CG32-9 TaxID=3232309 RepID=UPI00345C5D76